MVYSKACIILHNVSLEFQGPSAQVFNCQGSRARGCDLGTYVAEQSSIVGQNRFPRLEVVSCLSRHPESPFAGRDLGPDHDGLAHVDAAWRDALPGRGLWRCLLGFGGGLGDVGVGWFGGIREVLLVVFV